MSLNPSNYTPSAVLNAPALLYVGWGQPLTPYIESVTVGTSFDIPINAITWSISAPAGATILVNGDSITGAFSLNGSGPLSQVITVSSSVGTAHASYTLNNVVYSVPSSY
jgi:hypothetical protein